MAILNNSNAISAGGYDVNNSVRIRSSASAYFNRTPASAGNRQKFTYSVWHKSSLVNVTSLLNANSSSSNTDAIYFDSNKLVFESNVSGVNIMNLTTSQVFRDPSAWYHFVFSIDTTQATAANRIKIYVNGQQITAFTTATYPSQNSNLNINSNVAHNIGRFLSNGGSTYYSDGYYAETHFIDGQALTPSDFGATDATTGVWQPKAYSGTYGTNGFYLKFSDIATTSGSNAGLGKDFSGNSNYWTTNNISVTSGTTYDAMTDSPTNTSATVANYAVMNPINSYSSITVNNANLQLTLTEASYRKAVATMAFPTTGTYYLEATVSGGIDYVSYGIVTPEAPLSDAVGQTATGYGVITGTTNWDRKNNGSTSGNFWTISTTNPTLQIAYDATNGKLWLGYNNTWLDSSGGVTGNPSAGTNPTFTVDTARTYLPSFGGYKSNSIVINLNCGQRAFTYTPPTGFVALNTYNLPTPTILQGNKYMDATLWAGNGTNATSITGVNYQPDMVWIKNRTNSTGGFHNVFDSVRGVYKRIFTNDTQAEDTNTDTLQSFNSNGYTLGTNANVNATSSNYVGWSWKANGTGSTNTSGSITSTVSVNTTAGFSIVLYTGNGGAMTVGHGLGVAPKLIILKDRDIGRPWPVYHGSLATNQYLILNTTAAAATSTSYWNNTAPTSTVFSVNGLEGNVGANGEKYVAYCWAEIAGFSKFGSAVGNGSADGVFVYTGFQPKFILWKKSSDTGDWRIWDTSRSNYNAAQKILYPNASDAEYDPNNGTTNVDILSNGFKLRSSNLNESSATYIYAVYAENPFSTNNRAR